MSILPPNSTVLERAFDVAFAEQVEAIPENIIYNQWHPQSCPVELLGYLAWAVSVDDWNPDWDEGTKRGVIAASLDVHRHKGTPSSIKHVLAALGVTTEIKEYPATPVPHTIEAIAYATSPIAGGSVLLNAETIATVRRNLEYVKPARTTVSLVLGAAFKNTLSLVSMARVDNINRISADVKTAAQTATNSFTVAAFANVQPLLRLSTS